MYNRYLDDGSFVLLDPESQAHQPQPNQNRQGTNRAPGRQGQQPNQRHASPGTPNPGSQRRPAEPFRPKNDLAGDVTRGLDQLLDGVKQHFSLEKFDTGDILLVLIILFLYLEDGDNLELVITLGLMLLLGFHDNDDKEEKSD